MVMYKDLRYLPEVTSAHIAQKLLDLRDVLDHQITKGSTPNSLIIGTWNIREFDSGKGGERLPESYYYIAEIIDRFDICAIQEVRDDLDPLRKLIRYLGPNWDYFVTDVTSGVAGNRERMAFLYDKNRVMFRNLIGEVVLSDKSLIDGLQFARTPFFAAFQAGWFRFVLCTSHIYYGADHGEKKARRVKEIGAIAKELARRAKAEREVHILLGDLNIVDEADPTMKALKSAKFHVPEFPATNLGGTKFYDQIAFTTAGEKVRLLRHGTLDWRDVCFRPDEKDAYAFANVKEGGVPRYKNWDRGYKTWTTHQISDHLPIWVELEVDYSDDYLKRFTPET